MNQYSKPVHVETYASDLGWHHKDTHELLVSYRGLKTKLQHVQLPLPLPDQVEEEVSAEEQPVIEQAVVEQKEVKPKRKGK